MKPTPLLADVTPATMHAFACCGIKDHEKPGRIEKTCWLAANFKKGLRAKVLLTPDNRQCGYIEYLPGEQAWRGVDARGYMFVHCIWTFYRVYKGRGFARAMLEACIADTKEAGMHGVAVLTRDGPWLAAKELFLKEGFAVVDTAPPDYQLLVKKFDPTAPDPSFKGRWAEKLKKYDRGLTIIRSKQCPHIAKFAEDIAECAEEEFGLAPKVVELRSAREAQNAPTPYAVFSIIRDGRVLADHPVSRTRFRNIMRKLPRA